MLIKEIAEYFECSIDTVHTVLLNSGYNTKEKLSKISKQKVRTILNLKMRIYEFESSDGCGAMAY